MINPFHNPLFLTRLLKSYLVDIDRLWHIAPKKLKDFQDKFFRHIVKYAYSIPLYHEKYKSMGIHPSDIRGINDIKKLPLITKNDLQKNYPHGIVKKEYSTEQDFLVSTSGSTGKPVFIYLDLFSTIRHVEGFIRVLKVHGGIWNKSKILLIIDNKPGSIEQAAFQRSVTPFIKKFIPLNNIRYVYVGEKIEEIIKEITDFNPEFIGSDPNMLRELAYNKNNGQISNINPNCLFSSGAMLDAYTRKYIEKAFSTRTIDTYGTTEAGSIAFECTHGDRYHINSDFVFMEFLDEYDVDVSYGKPGRVVISRLYGKGTPIIRYTGLEDIVTPVETEQSCGISSAMIKNICGRSLEMILLPNGKKIAPFHMTTIPASVMDDLKTYKIKQFQIIQHKIDEIEVLVIIDEKLRNIGPPVKKILSEINNRFRKITGSDVNIEITEVNQIDKNARSDYVKLIVSKL
jgi:phenylacetate-CoA ligase